MITSLILTCSLSSAETLIWSEEFNYTSAPDSDVWSYDLGADGWGNAELQNYTSDSANAWVNGSNLVITAVRQGNTFTSARINTLDKLTFKYGTVEARIQTPNLANGLWPAFWTLGNNYPDVGWPECGEIDIMEMGNLADARINAANVNQWVGSHAHWGTLPNHPNYGDELDYGADISDTFVIYRMVWTPTSITTYINGQQIWVMNTASIAEFNAPHFLLLNLAVGGTYTGILNVDGITAPFPAEYKVDWIRLYDNGDTVLGGSSTLTPPAPGMNYLENSGFETGGLNPWTGYEAFVESTNDTYYNSGDHVVTHSGDQVAKVYGGFTGGENYNGFYQDVVAEPGSVWTASGWALTPLQDLMVGANTAWIEVSFRNAADTVLSLYRSPILTSANVTPGAWMNLEITEQINPSTYAVIGSVATMTAPASTAKARYQVVFRQTNYDGGSVYFDDLSLVEQIFSFTLNAALVGGNFQISFPTQDGVSYEVGYKSSLTNENWTSIETIIGDGNTNTASYPVSFPVRYYRVSTP